MTRKKFSWILVTLIIFGFFVTSLVSYKVAHDMTRLKSKSIKIHYH